MRWIKVGIALGGFLAAACGLVINLEEDPPPAADADVDGDQDSDVDSDVDSDSDTGSDSDTVSDTGTEAIPCEEDADCPPDGDRDVCTIVKCHNFFCERGVNPCDDGRECTDDRCEMDANGADPATGCVHVGVNERCPGVDTCELGRCAPALGADARGCQFSRVICADVECSVGFCSPRLDGAECVYEFAAGDVCIDGEICVPGVGCVPAIPGDTPCSAPADCDLALGDPGACTRWNCNSSLCERQYECDGGQYCDPEEGCVDVVVAGGG